MTVEIILKDDGRRRGVEALFAYSPVLFPDGEAGLGFAAAEALVLQGHGQLRSCRQIARKSFDTMGEVGRRSIEPLRQSDYDVRNAVVFRSEVGHLCGHGVEGCD